MDVLYCSLKWGEIEYLKNLGGEYFRRVSSKRVKMINFKFFNIIVLLKKKK